MGAVLAQDGKIISNFSRKFNNAQLKYTVTGQKLLAGGQGVQALQANNSGMQDQDPQGSPKPHTRWNGPR